MLKQIWTQQDAAEHTCAAWRLDHRHSLFSRASMHLSMQPPWFREYGPICRIPPLPYPPQSRLAPWGIPFPSISSSLPLPFNVFLTITKSAALSNCASHLSAIRTYNNNNDGVLEPAWLVVAVVIVNIQSPKITNKLA